jgi:uncharacterized protein YbbK (DUF523 family)
MIHVLVSACLLGEKVRYNGADASCLDSIIAKWSDEQRIIPFCPEVAGGLGVPRPAAEIQGGDGDAVLDGAGRVVTIMGEDATDSFVRGARLTLELVLRHNVRMAVLKDGSPSCGSAFMYDGSFTGAKRQGHGVTTALLERNGIRVFSERQLDAAARHLAALEGTMGAGSGAMTHEE